MIQVKDLCKRFGATVAVDGLSFQVAKGEILGFLGPNGAGKTTTMRVLTGYYPPTSGSASIAGHDVLEEPLAARRAVGYLPENVPLYVDMRVEEYLSFVAGVKGLGSPEARNQVIQVMEQTGIAHRRGQLIKQLSKGYRQRVGLAQAMLGDPEVLILDEPTIGLDPRQIVEIRELIKGMAGEKTVILSSHILSEVAATCSRVVIITSGRLVTEGPPAMLTPGGAGGGRLRLACTGDGARLAEVMAKVPGVAGVTPTEDHASGAACFLVETDGQHTVHAELARAVIEAGGGLVELSPLAASLEEVFMQLTTDDPAKGEEAA